MAKSKATPSPPTDKALTEVIQKYGDLIYDICETILWSQSNAQATVRGILKSLRTHLQGSAQTPLHEYERSWVLKIMIQHLRKNSSKHGKQLSPSEQVMLDASLASQARLKYIDSYLHRLPFDDQLVLLLKDKYQVDYEEISTALEIPEGSLRVIRLQALRKLEEWIWNESANSPYSQQ